MPLIHLLEFKFRESLDSQGRNVKLHEEDRVGKESGDPPFERTSLEIGAVRLGLLFLSLQMRKAPFLWSIFLILASSILL